MVSTYTPLGTEQIATGEKINTWGEALNNSVFALLVEAVSNVAVIPVTGNMVLTAPNGVSAVVRSALLKFTDAGMSAAATITVPASEKLWWVHYTGTTYNLVITCGGATATIRPNSFALVYCDGIDVINTEVPLDKIKPPTANVSMNGYRLTNAAAAVNPNDVPTYAQLISLTGTDQAALAAAWAANPEDVVVAGGLYSSRHYSIKAAASALLAQTWDPSAYYTKTATDALFAALGSTTRVPRTANTQIALSNKGNFIDITSGTFTQTFAAVASLANGWFCYLRNAGTGDITLDPNGAEQIDGLASYVMYPGETRLVLCDGLALRTVVLNAFNRIFDASGTFIRPPGYSHFGLRLHGGGGGGGKQGDSVSAWGGAAGEVFTMHHAPTSVFGASVSVGVGSGGAGAAVEGSGAVGGSTSLGAFSAAGGIGGVRGVAAWPSYTYGVSKDSDGYVSTAGGSLWSAQFIDPVAAGPAAFTGGIASFPATGSNGTGVGAGGGATHTGPKGGDGFRGQARIWGEI